MYNFKLISFNVNGLGEELKRRKIFNWLKQYYSKCICFLQETHSTAQCENKWKTECDSELIFSHGSSNSRGVAIFISK